MCEKGTRPKRTAQNAFYIFFPSSSIYKLPSVARLYKMLGLTVHLSVKPNESDSYSQTKGKK
jgi:hypothetical protein